MSDQLEGRNAVKEALMNNRVILEVVLLASGNERVLEDIARLAGQKNVPVRRLDRKKMDQMSVTGRHQGVIAIVPAYEYTDLSDLIKMNKSCSEPLILLLDGIVDPHNLGSALRSAEVFGAAGVVIPKRRATGVTPTVAKVASGALEHIPVVQVTNLTDTIKTLKKEGFWIVGGEGSSQKNAMDQDMTGPIGLVVGSEGKGISRLVKEQCDYLVKIPMRGQTGSLNASVATGILLYEVIRQRIKREETGNSR